MLCDTGCLAASLSVPVATAKLQNCTRLVFEAMDGETVVTDFYLSSIASVPDCHTATPGHPLEPSVCNLAVMEPLGMVDTGDRFVAATRSHWHFLHQTLQVEGVGVNAQKLIT